MLLRGRPELRSSDQPGETGVPGQPHTADKLFTLHLNIIRHVNSFVIKNVINNCERKSL